MIVIDLPADLHFEDDDGLLLARVSRAPRPDLVTPGAILVAGGKDAWTWVEVVATEGGWAHLRQLTARQAAAKSSLVAPTPHTA